MRFAYQVCDRHHNTSPDAWQRQLQLMGDKGWELVSVVALDSAHSYYHSERAYFKKQLPSGIDADLAIAIATLKDDSV